MRTAYFDCFGGAAGDMLVASLLDAGLDLNALRAELAKLKLPGYSVSLARATREGLAGARFSVIIEPPAHDHDHDHDHERRHDSGHAHGHGRNLGDILAMLDQAGLPERADMRIRKVFRRLADAEASVHGTSVEQVHFHEVGAIDSIVDIVGAAMGLELLGVDRVLCSPIPLGSGTVKCDHGVLPVPAPATAALMRDGVIAPSDFPAELCTPTAAAIMTALAESFTTLPAMALDAIGYGAGTREDPGRVNMLRVFIGHDDAGDAGQVDTVVELAANIDDTPGQLLGAVTEMLMTAGALDAWTAPITMKKSRPAVQLGVLCEPGDVERMEQIIFRQTTTIGIRRHTCGRTKLRRRHVTVETPYGPVRVKVSGTDGVEYSVVPEFDDCVRAGEAHHVPVKEVQAAALALHRQGASQ